MKTVKAFDIDGVEIKNGNLVEIAELQDINHPWIKVGNTFRVAKWADRSLGEEKFIVVFLRTKNWHRLCGVGVQDKQLRVVSEQ